MAAVFHAKTTFSVRTRFMTDVVKQLEKFGCAVEKITMHVDHSVVRLKYVPAGRYFSGEQVKIIGGAEGLHRVMEKRFGIVRVQWLLPYVHHPVQSRRVH